MVEANPSQSYEQETYVFCVFVLYVSKCFSTQDLKLLKLLLHSLYICSLPLGLHFATTPGAGQGSWVERGR